MPTIEDYNVGTLAAVFLLHEDVTVAETAIGLWANENGTFLLLHKLLMEIEVVGFEDFVATVVN